MTHYVERLVVGAVSRFDHARSVVYSSCTLACKRFPRARAPPAHSSPCTSARRATCLRLVFSSSSFSFAYSSWLSASCHSDCATRRRAGEAVEMRGRLARHGAASEWRTNTNTQQAQAVPRFRVRAVPLVCWAWADPAVSRLYVQASHHSRQSWTDRALMIKSKLATPPLSSRLFLDPVKFHQKISH